VKALIAKILPFVIGIVLGWLLFNPPRWMEPLGPARYVVVAVLCFLLLITFICLLILKNLPQDVQLTRLGQEPEPELRALAQRFHRLGFESAGPLLEVGVSPPAKMVALVHQSEPIYGAVFRTSTIPAVTGVDLVSVLHDGHGGLTTGDDPRGATLPGGPGAFRQSFPKRGVEDLLPQHQRAMQILARHGVSWKRLSASSFEHDFKQAIARQRKAFLAAPVRNTLLAIYRSALSAFPHVGPLDRQPGFEKQVRIVQSGRHIL
jgi:hypothetical protein